MHKEDGFRNKINKYVFKLCILYVLWNMAYGEREKQH